MEDSSWLKKRVYEFFMASAIAAEKRKLEGSSPTLKQRLLARLGEWLVYGPIKDQFGLTRLRGAFTGGEAMGEDTFVFYRALGIKLRQLYGQTESSAYNAIQSLDEVRLHTVGRPLPGVELKISDAGEILVRSGSVFSGYFKQEEATRAKPRRRLAAHRRRRLPRARRPPRRARTPVRCRAHRQGRALHPQLYREPPEVQPVHQGRRGARKRPRHAGGHRLHRQGRGRPLGRTARHLLHLLCRPVAETAGDRPRSPPPSSTSTAHCRMDCSCGSSSACTRNSTPTTARSREPARFAATSSRSATSRSSTRSMIEQRTRADEGTDQLRVGRSRRDRTHAVGAGGLIDGLGTVGRIGRQWRAWSA